MGAGEEPHNGIAMKLWGGEAGKRCVDGGARREREEREMEWGGVAVGEKPHGGTAMELYGRVGGRGCTAGKEEGERSQGKVGTMVAATGQGRTR